MAKVCKNCGKNLKDEQHFCSKECYEEYDRNFKERIAKAVKKDRGHTEGFSKD